MRRLTHSEALNEYLPTLPSPTVTTNYSSLILARPHTISQSFPLLSVQ